MVMTKAMVKNSFSILLHIFFCFSCSISDIVNSINLHTGYCFCKTIGPLYYYRIYLAGGQTRMQRRLHGALVSMYRIIFKLYSRICCENIYYCTDAITILVLPFYSKLYPVSLLAIFYQHVAVYFCRSIQMINNKIKVAIIVKVCTGRAI